MLSTLVTAAKLLFDASRNPDFAKDSPFALNALRKATSLSKPYLVRLEQELARHNVETFAPDHRQVRASKAVQFRDVLRKVIKIAQDLSKTRSRRPRESVRLSLLSDVHQFLGLEVARAMREVKRLEHTLEGKHKRRRHRRHRGSTDKPEDHVHYNTGESEGGNAVEISREMVSLTSGASHHAEEEDKHSARQDEAKTTAGQDSVRQVPHSVASLASAASHHTVAAAPPQSPNDIIPAEDAAGSTHTHHTTPAPSIELNRPQSHTTPELSDGDEHPRSPPSPSVKTSTHCKEPIANPVSRTTSRHASPSTRGTPMPLSETSFDRRISAAHARLDSVEKVLASPSRHDPLSEQNLSRHNFSRQSGSSCKRSKHGSGTKKDGGEERGSKLSLAAGSEQHGSAKGEKGEEEEEESKGKGEVEGGKTTSRGTGSRASSHHSRREEAKIKSGTSVHASHVSSSSSKGKPKVEDGKTTSRCSRASSHHSGLKQATTMNSEASAQASHVSSSSSKGKLKVEDGKTTSSHASTHHSRREEATTIKSGTSVHGSHVSSSSSRKGDENKPKTSPSATSEQHGSAKSSSSSSSSKGKLKVEDGKTTSSHASTSTHHSKLKQATPIPSGTNAHASHSSSSSSPSPILPDISKKKSSPSSSLSSSSTSSTKNSTNNNKVYEQKKSESNIVEVPEQEEGEGEEGEQQQQQQQVLSSFTLEQQQQDEMDRERERKRL